MNEEMQERFAAAYSAAQQVAQRMGYNGYESQVVAQGAGNAAMYSSNDVADVHESIAHFRVADGGRDTALIAEAAWRAANT